MDNIGSNSYRNYLSTSSGQRNTEKQATKQRARGSPIKGELNESWKNGAEEKLPYVNFG